MTPFIWIAVGLPASGKSTWIDKSILNSTQNALVLGTDRIIDEYAEEKGKTYNEVFQEFFDEAVTIFFSQLEVSLLNGRNIFIDRTNLTKRTRHKILSRVPKTYKKVAVVFTCDPEIHAKRLESRPGKNIPHRTIKNMKASFEYPTLEEGFDSITGIVTG